MNCWECQSVRLGGDYFPAACDWFVENNKGGKKNIPGTVVDNGCKFFKQKEELVEQDSEFKD